MKRFLFPLAALLALTCATATQSQPRQQRQQQLTERQQAIHALNRLAFGPRPGDVDSVMNMGVDAWIDQQLHPERIDDRAVDAELKIYPTLGMTDGELIRTYYAPIVQLRRQAQMNHTPIDKAALMQLQKNSAVIVRDLVAQRIIRAADSRQQLNEVMVDFWFNPFNGFRGKGIDRFLLTSSERYTIRPHIWGKFEDLLMATAKSPAMLFYLDNAHSIADPEHRDPRVERMLEMRRPKLAQKGGINENYAREIMELHTLGVDGGYTQKDVTELARVFTGWSIDPKTGTFIFRRAMHDVGPKTVLGVYFPPGGGIEEGEKMIHILANSPATAHHIAFELCQRFVSDNPPKALVDRVAQRFLATGGDLRETVKAVIDSPEFWAESDYRAKVKSPFEFAISALRAVDATIVNPVPVARALQMMGEPLYGAQPPTGYSENDSAWINTGELINRLNFALGLASNKLPGVQSNVAALGDSVDTLALALTGGSLTEKTRQTIEAHVPSDNFGEHAHAPLIAGLILGSPEFQRE